MDHLEQVNRTMQKLQNVLIIIYSGKTLTAEAVAELLRRPLYIAGATELTTDPSELEKTLGGILDVILFLYRGLPSFSNVFFSLRLLGMRWCW